MNLRSRLEKLETVEQHGTVVIWRNIDETDDQAIARWRAQHGGQDPENVGHVHVIGWAKESSSLTESEKERGK